MNSRVFALGAMLLCVFPSVGAGGSADLLQVQTVQTREDYSVLPNGEINYAAEMQLNVNEYNRMKSQNVNPYRLVRDVRTAGSSVWSDVKVSTDDAAHCYRVNAVISGLMKNTGERWEGEMSKGYDFVNLANNEMAFTCAVDSGEGYRFLGKAFIKFPPGATDPTWDQNARLVSYRLPYRAARAGGRKRYAALALLCGAVFVACATTLLRKKTR